MKYISIDIETTGIDPKTCQIIEFAAIIEDTENILPFKKIPKYERIIKHPSYSGSAFAINMNQRIFKILAENSSQDIIPAESLARGFYYFTASNGLHGETLNVAGKNFARFDWEFLINIPDWNKYITMSHRVIDPAILCVNWKWDDHLPNSELCKSRTKIKGPVTHKALDDAWDVIQIIRKKTKNYVSFSQ